MAAIPALFGLLMAAVVTGQMVDIQPAKAVRRLGDELQVLCKVPYEIDSCRMTVGNTPYRLLPSEQNGEVVYYGQGLKFGECGALIKNIREEWNGNISCTLPPQTGSIELQGTMHLVVAKQPGEPHLRVSRQPFWKEGDQFLVQCVVPDGRPVARISWFLDEEPLVQGVHHPVITGTPGTDLETIQQNLTLVLTADHNGKFLACRAEHEAMDQPREAKMQLAVHYPPKRLESGPITIFGLKIGEEGRLNVTVRSNPPPTVQWTIGDITLEPQQATEEFQALAPIHLGSGYYNITLVVRHITKEDVDRKYYLRVSNDIDSEQFHVQLSTMDEPAGVDLDTGAIVGIVIAVLILLVAVSLLVFAKATHRWFFAGGNRGRDHAKASGESTPAGDVLLQDGMPLPSRTSDTESAVGGRERSRLAGLSARVRAVLPRAKDKVQAAAPTDTEDKPLSDEKKSVVYAELQLGDQTTTDKPPPPSTEYAEIVYTDKPNE